MAVLVAIEAVVLVLLTLLVAGLLRSHAEILRKLHALGAGLELDGAAALSLRPRGDRTTAVGSPAARDVGGAGLHDDVVHIPVAGVGHRTLLAFLSSSCLTCRRFWEALADRGALGLPPDIRVVAVTKDAAQESVSILRDVAPADLPVVLSSEAWREYDVPGAPYFVLVDGATGRVQGEGTGVSWEQVRALVTTALDDERAGKDTVEAQIDRELLANGVTPGDPSLYRTARDIARDAGAP